MPTTAAETPETTVARTARPPRARLLMVVGLLVALVLGAFIEGFVRIGLSSGSSPVVQQGVILSVGAGVPFGGQGCMVQGPCGTFVQEAGVRLRAGEHISFVVLNESEPSPVPQIVVIAPSS